MSETSADCIFCTIVAGEVQADVLGSNEHAIAFKDLNPQAPFHVLVVPVDHGCMRPSTRSPASGTPGAPGASTPYHVVNV